MIKIYNTNVETYEFNEVKEYSKGCWINMVNPSEKEIEEVLKMTIIENFQKEMVEEDFYKYEVQLQ